MHQTQNWPDHPWLQRVVLLVETGCRKALSEIARNGFLSPGNVEARRRRPSLSMQHLKLECPHCRIVSVACCPRPAPGHKMAAPMGPSGKCGVCTLSVAYLFSGPEPDVASIQLPVRRGCRRTGRYSPEAFRNVPFYISQVFGSTASKLPERGSPRLQSARRIFPMSAHADEPFGGPATGPTICRSPSLAMSVLNDTFAKRYRL